MLPLMCLALTTSTRPYVDPSWQLAFERGGDLWISNADGRHATRLARNAQDPKWSPDGKRIAFVRGSRVFLFDMASRRETFVLSFDPKAAPLDPEDGQTVWLDWDPKRPALLCSTLTGRSIQLYNLSIDPDIKSYAGSDSPGPEFPILGGGIPGPTYAPCWSPSGKNLAYVRAGDVWLAHRSAAQMKRNSSDSGSYEPSDKRPGIIPGLPRDWILRQDYYDTSARLAPLASGYEAESGVSLTTPYWVDDLAWGPGEKRLYFHFQRIGGGGVSLIGYLSLVRAKSRVSDFDWDLSGFRAATHWLPLSMVFSPRICPNGRTLSYVHHDSDLMVCDLSGRHRRELMSDVCNPDWRPTPRR